MQRWYQVRADRPGEVTLDQVVDLFARAGWPLPDLFAQVLDLPPERLLRGLHACLDREARGMQTGADDLPLRPFLRSQPLQDRLYQILLHPDTSQDLIDRVADVSDALARLISD